MVVWRLHLQDVTAKGCILILLGLIDVFPSMPDLVMFCVSPFLVAPRFGLSEKLFRGGLSTHLGRRKLVLEGVRRNRFPAANFKGSKVKGSRRGRKRPERKRARSNASPAPGGQFIYRASLAMVACRPVSRRRRVEPSLVQRADFGTDQWVQARRTIRGSPNADEEGVRRG